MRAEKTPYAGHTEEEGGYFQGSGVVYRFAEGELEYKFNVEDSMPEYASSLPSTVSGRLVTIGIHAPYGEGSSVIAIPSECSVFAAGIRHLRSIGVKHVSFFNRVSGGFSQISIEELSAPNHSFKRTPDGAA